MLKKIQSRDPAPEFFQGAWKLLKGTVVREGTALQTNGEVWRFDVHLKIDEKNKLQALEHPFCKGVHDLTRCASPHFRTH